MGDPNHNRHKWSWKVMWESAPVKQKVKLVRYGISMSFAE